MCIHYTVYIVFVSLYFPLCLGDIPPGVRINASASLEWRERRRGRRRRTEHAGTVLTLQSCTLLSRVMVPVRQVRCIWRASIFSCTQNAKQPLSPVHAACTEELRGGGFLRARPRLNVSPASSSRFCQFKMYNWTQRELWVTEASFSCSLRQTAASVFASPSTTSWPPVPSPIHPLSLFLGDSAMQTRQQPQTV